WNMDLYLAVDKEIPGGENTTISGKFFSRVYEGPYKNTGKWMKDFEAVVKSNGLTCKKVYMWYTTCPKCAKKYGKNYVVILAQIE
ncbi:MAG: hydrolase, partial [Bacteroidota bacterium]